MEDEAVDDSIKLADDAVAAPISSKDASQALSNASNAGNADAQAVAHPAGVAQRPDSQIEPMRTFIEAGDLVIVFLSRDRPPLPITVTPGLALANTYGTFAHADMVGLPFGAKLSSRNRRGFIHLLRPTPELWTIALPHRTQILYSPDMSFIAAHLGLSPGARLIEAGTGSGSFSHYSVRCVARKHPQSSGLGWKGPMEEAAKLAQGRSEKKVSGAQRRREMKRKRNETKLDTADSDSSSSGSSDNDAEDGALEDSENEMEEKEPIDEREARILRHLASPPDANVGERDGRVWSFEFHAGRAAKAWNEFEEHSLFPTLSLRHRNVVKNGFGLEDVADAVFLDLPAPWQALHHAAQALRRDTATRICCFSPCVEQVLKTVAAMRRGRQTDDSGALAIDAPEERVTWTDIETYECLQRTHVSQWTGPGSLVPTQRIDEAILRIRLTEEKKARRREMQIERTRREREAREKQRVAASGEIHNGSTVVSTGEKRKRDGALDEDEQSESEAQGGENGEDESSMHANGSAQVQKNQVATGAQSVKIEGEQQPLQTRDGKTLHRANVYSRPFPEMRGHTSYLTFATLPPRVVRQESDPLLERERQAEARKAAQAERMRARQEAKKLEQEKQQESAAVEKDTLAA